MASLSYPGKDLTVSYDTDMCQHAGVCVRSLPAVFDVDQDPWIRPDAAGSDQVIETIDACPSGALGYTPAGARPE